MNAAMEHVEVVAVTDLSPDKQSARPNPPASTRRTAESHPRWLLDPNGDARQHVTSPSAAQEERQGHANDPEPHEFF